MKKAIPFLVFLVTTSAVFSQDTSPQINKLKTPSKAITGFIDPNIYYDTRGKLDFTLNALAILPHRFTYFTFTNYASNDNNVDLLNHYSEHHLYWGLTNKSPFDLSLQWMTIAGDKNDALRLGFRWRIGDTQKINRFFQRIGLTYNIAFHIYQLDDDKNRSPWLTQIEHFYRLTLFENRVYISGFVDQDVYCKDNKLFTFVTEHQIGARLIDNLHAVAEYRFNDYLPLKKAGLGLGLEYVINF